MDISVIVPTRNRADLLKVNLKSLERQEHPSDRFEVIVVDNDSTDGTESVVKEKSGRGKIEVRYVLEKEVGLAHVRNRGIEESRGEIVAYIDDDAEADPLWLATLAQAQQERPEAVCFSGKVLLKWEEPPPPWWEPCFDGALSGFDWGDEPKPFAYPHCPVGGNLFVKRAAFDEFGTFRTDLGRKGAGLLSSEETEFALRLFRAGKPVLYEPRAIVHHQIDKERLTKSYLRKQAYWDGWSHANFEKGYQIGSLVSDAESAFRLGLHSITHLNFSLQRQTEFCRRVGRVVNRIFSPNTPPL